MKRDGCLRTWQVYLEVKAGSLHEKETQQGIAHFVEHVRDALSLSRHVRRTPRAQCADRQG